jgi:5,6-dimethylbenzimidazole synthase
MTTAPPRFDDGFLRQLEELFRWRRDVRRFRTDPIDARLQGELLWTAALAPSVGNSQPSRFVKVEDPRRRERIRAIFRAANEEALAGYRGERARLYASLKLAGLDAAPVQLAVFVDPDPEAGAGLGRRTMPETVPYSAVLAIHTLWLAARARGIGLGWVSIVDPAALHRELDVDPAWSFIAYLCLGFPEEEHLDPELERSGWQARLDPREHVLER